VTQVYLFKKKKKRKRKEYPPCPLQKLWVIMLSFGNSDIDEA